MNKSIMFASAVILSAGIVFVSNGVRAQGVPQTVELAKIDVQKLAAGYRASKVIGSSVVNEENEVIGKIDDLLILLRHEIAISGVTVRATLREHFLWETGHERGPAGTVYGLCRGAGRGDRTCRSGGAVA